MKIYIFKFLFLCLILFTVSCENNNDQYNLSFCNITIGKQFPESQIKEGNFKKTEDFLPEYKGKVLFNLPSCKDIPLNVTAYGDIESKKIIEIEFNGFTFSQINEFYNILVTKYGEPKSVYDKSVNNSLSSILYNIHLNLKENQEQNLWYDPIVIAEWKLFDNGSRIVIFCYPYVFSKEKWTDITISYSNEENCRKNIKKINEEQGRQERNKKMEEKRKNEEERRNAFDKFKNTHPDVMNQDF